MAEGTDATTPLPTTTSPDAASLYGEGIVAGVIGAATVAVWFLILDTINGRPLYTPTEALPVSLEMVLMFTWVHGLAFAAIGGVASRLLGMAERSRR